MKTKNIILTLLLQSVMIFSAYSQQLKGVQEFSGNGSGGNHYTKVNWTASYTITFDGISFHIGLINPTTSVSSTSLYGHGNEFYSKSDLGLANWPNTNLTTANFTLGLTVIMPDGKAIETSAKKDEDGYLATIAEYKGATISSFKVSSVRYMNFNYMNDDMLNRLINERKNNTQNPVTSSGNQTNSNQSKNTGLPANTSGNDPLANYNSQTKTTGNNNPMTNGNNTNSSNTNPLINYNTNTSSGSSAVDNFNKGYQQGQQIADIATGLVSLLTPSPEEIQRRERQAEEYKRQRKIAEDLALKKREIEGEARFRAIYLPLMDQAIKGDENARMILCFSSFNLLSTQLVPERRQWLDQAYRNNNVDAILEKSCELTEYHSDRIECIPYLEHAATLESTDAMLRLATWYDRKKRPEYGGENEKTAFEYYTKAAKIGSPNAMYCLGMIYKYGIVEDLNDGHGIKNIRRKMHVKYNVPKDEKKAFEWFSKSIQPDYKVSLFYRGSYSFYCGGSHFEKDSYKELAIMYKQGKVVPKNIQKAKELKRSYETFILDNKY